MVIFCCENKIICFVTHSRAMHFLEAAYESYGRGGKFCSHKISKHLYFINIYKNGFGKYGGHLLGENKALQAR